MSNVKFTDNSDEVLRDLEIAIKRGAVAIGMRAETHVKEKTPVDTGRLRNSMTYALSGEGAHITSYSGDHGEPGGTYTGTLPAEKNIAVYVGTNVKYAAANEFGENNHRAVHMIQRGVTEHKDEYQQLLKDSMKNS